MLGRTRRVQSRCPLHGMVWAGRDLKAHPVPTPCHGQGHLPLEQVAPSPCVQPGLEHCQGWGSHSFSGKSLCQRLSTLTGNNFCLISNLNFPCSSVNPSPLVPSLQSLMMVPLHHPFSPLQTLEAALRSPRSFSSPGSTAPMFSACLHTGAAPALAHPRGLLWTCSNSSMSF